MALTKVCPVCNGEMRIWKSRYGGNDPDVFDAGPCTNEMCVDGEVELQCEGWMCNRGTMGFPATELVTFSCGSVESYCVRCARTAREDADMEPETQGAS